MLASLILFIAALSQGVLCLPQPVPPTCTDNGALVAQTLTVRYTGLFVVGAYYAGLWLMRPRWGRHVLLRRKRNANVSTGEILRPNLTPSPAASPLTFALGGSGHLAGSGRLTGVRRPAQGNNYLHHRQPKAYCPYWTHVTPSRRGRYEGSRRFTFG
ncbi:hypothetical protein BD779DRAFT_1477776 [Infundibulicybe gibba]|nr:hypothetical protein BD779DRAFT_1477776 [Infundibulicybe gibba]